MILDPNWLRENGNTSLDRCNLWMAQKMFISDFLKQKGFFKVSFESISQHTTNDVHVGDQQRRGMVVFDCAPRLVPAWNFRPPVRFCLMVYHITQSVPGSIVMFQGFQEPKLAKSRSKDSKVSGMTKAWRSNKKLAQRDAAERAGNLSISKSWMLRGFDGTSLGIGLVTA